MSVPLRLRVNGAERELLAEPTIPLLYALREHLHLTGTKEGCTTGACGACTVNLDGRAVYSCLVPAAAAEGCEITTIEGIGTPEDLHPLQQAFMECGAVQCGFCIPGMIMAARAFLAANPDPDEEQIREGLSGNFCRCTGYVKIVQAVAAAARAGREA